MSVCDGNPEDAEHAGTPTQTTARTWKEAKSSSTRNGIKTGILTSSWRRGRKEKGGACTQVEGVGKKGDGKNSCG